MRNTRSAWHHEVYGNLVAVYDDFSGSEMSVTNDAENVVDALCEMIDLTGKTIIYRDTEGRWDILRHSDGEFIGFGSLGGAMSLESALKALSQTWTKKQGEDISKGAVAS
jgi:hypothetical protein